MRLRIAVAVAGLVALAGALAGQLPLVAAIVIVLYVAWMFIRDHRRRSRGGWNRD